MMVGRRLIALIISFSLLIIPEIHAENQPTSSHRDDDNEAVLGAERQCSPDGPAVRFPFALLGKQPETCGSYNSSYNLHCDPSSRTILELPAASSSIKLAVTNISYSSQTMQVQPLETCLPKLLRYLDLSTTPFHNPSRENGDSSEVDQLSLFKCSTTKYGRSFGIDPNGNCLGYDGFTVYVTRRNGEIKQVEQDELEDCTKMFDTGLIPEQLLSGYSFTTSLNWSFPQCRSCEERGGICGWINRTDNQIGCQEKKHHSGILKILRISGPIVGSLFLLILVVSVIYFAHSTKKLERENLIMLKKFLEDYAAMKPTRYSYADIKKITNDFKGKVGEGGYGSVFKGQVADNIFVAVKLLHDSIGNGEEFINEVGTMGTIHHVNVVRLLGFCADGYNRALVYEFLPNGSLDKFIFPNGQQPVDALGMKRLEHIAVGIARGIEYLHQGCEQRILHFDIKPQNILLDHNYNPKISDFGLAKLCGKGRSDVSMTAARGTMGYIAPEVFSRHFGANVSYKSDIYSFGKLLLEMVGGRKNVDANAQNLSQVNFPEWVYKRLVNGEDLRIFRDDENVQKINEVARKLATVGLWCIQWNPMDRPSISIVLQMLEGSGEGLSLPPDPFTSSSGNPRNPADPAEHKIPALAAISELE